MARICAACRLPVDDPRNHDCPEDGDPDGGDGANLAVHVSGSVTAESDLLGRIQGSAGR